MRSYNITEQAHLPGLRRAVHAAAEAHHPLKRLEQLMARGKFIKGTHFDQAFQCALAHRAKINPLAEIPDILKRRGLACGEDDLHRTLPHILDRSQPIADHTRTIRLFLYDEIVAAEIDVRRQYLDVH